jgi:phosphatidylserine/phosphatidylglycerophosphate/cardiolipin synthase-like enzyme
MHNKFVVVDDIFVMTGSFNWTVSAGKSNQENLLVADNQFYVKKYTEEFDRLWRDFSKNKVEAEEYYAATKIQKGYRNNQYKKKGKY